MHKAKVIEGNVGQLISEAVTEAGVALPAEQQRKSTVPRMYFTGFRVEGVPDGKLTVDVRGRSVVANGKTHITSWQSGISVTVPDDVDFRHGDEAVFQAAVLHRWLLQPGRVVNLNRNDPNKTFAGIRLSNGRGLILPRILPAVRVSMHCPCGKDAFHTWNIMLKRAKLLESQGREPYDDLPRLKCAACGRKLNPKFINNQTLLPSTDGTVCDAGYTDREHPDIKGVIEGYTSDATPVGGGTLFPRLWVVYPTHMAPDVWAPDASDTLGNEINARYSMLGLTIRPISSLVKSQGRPRPRSIVMEAPAHMSYAWLDEHEIHNYCNGNLEYDYHKKLVPVIRQSYEPRNVAV